MGEGSREQRIVDLCGFIVSQINTRRRRKVTIMIDGERFGIASVEDLVNPFGPIPTPWRVVQAPTGA